MKRLGFTLWVVFSLLAAFCTRANAQLVITPTFDSTITTDPNAATIEASINTAISNIESKIKNPITVNIKFAGMDSGLGQSSTFISNIPYSTYVSDLQTRQTLSANDISALATLPVGANNPVNGDSSLTLTLPLLRALGVNANPPGGIDSTVSVNIGLTNISRTGTQDPAKFDLVAVEMHEIDEVLGIGGSGSQLNEGTTGPVGALDLFRYSGVGTRSYVLSSTTVSYFSIDGGVTNLVNFNQASGGSDYGDWGDGVTPADSRGHTPGQVQDAFGDPGAIVNLGANELTAFDVIGYDLEPVPEPGSIGLLAAGGLLLIGFRRRGKTA